jgi:hypothetical protein
VVENSPLPVVVRSFLTMVKANTRETLLATYQFARTHGIEFNLAAFDPSYPHSTTISFDRDYISACSSMDSSAPVQARSGSRRSSQPLRCHCPPANDRIVAR